MSQRKQSRRQFIKATAACGLAASLPVPALAKKTDAQPARTVVVGFDGVDPRLIDRWIASGDLPHLASLRKKGTLCPLASTSPPNSPVAWSTFATGQWPSEHGVFGFLRRDAKNYLPGVAPFQVNPPRFRAGAYQAASAVSHRHGAAFWELLDQRKVSQSMLFVPYAFPPPKLANGRVLAGLGTPDLRFTNSSFTFFTSDPAPSGQSDRVAGGRMVRLSIAGDTVDTVLTGPPGPDRKRLQMPLRLELDRKRRKLTLLLGGRKERLAEGKRSGWFPVLFQGPGFELAGKIRFFLLAVKDRLALYASPISLDPAHPALPLGHPQQWMEKAYAVNGGLPTVGWVHDTSAVNAGALPKEIFLSQILDVMEGRAQILLNEIRAGASQLILSVFTGTDRAAHIFYRDLSRKDGGALRTVYRAMDKIIGRVMRQVPRGTRLLFLSDHGFHAFDHMLHVNTWLETQGLLTRKSAGAKVQFLRGINWGKTPAYAMGNGQVYLNMQGREARGWVSPGAERAQFIEKIRSRLLALKDPTTGSKPVRNVYDVYDQASAAVRHRAPDLQVAFAPGYRSSWETSLGGAPIGDPFAPNPKAWCGDHAAADVDETPGFLASNVKIDAKQARLVDLAATLLSLHGAPFSGPGVPLIS